MQCCSTCASARCSPIESLGFLDHVLLLPSVASADQGAQQGDILKLVDKVVHGVCHWLVNHSSHRDCVGVPLQLGHSAMIPDILCSVRSSCQAQLCTEMCIRRCLKPDLRRAVGVMKPLSIRSGSGGSQLKGCRPVNLTRRGCRGTHLSGVAASLLSISVTASCKPQVGSLGVTFCTLSRMPGLSLSMYSVCNTSSLVLVLKGTRLARSEAESPLNACKAGMLHRYRRQ